MDEETLRYAAILKIKQARLHELDKQAAAHGAFGVPPHVEMERGSLKEELGMMEIAIESPARADIGDELGPRGRFLVYHQQNQDIKKSVAALAVEFEKFVAVSQEWRMMHRTWLLIIGVAVIIILAAVVAIVTAIFLKGGL